MPRDGAIIFSDPIGKLDLIRVDCDKRGRDGCYGLGRLTNKQGRELIEWLDELTADVRGSKRTILTIYVVFVAHNYRRLRRDRKCPLSGVKQTWRLRCEMSAYNPWRPEQHLRAVVK